MHTHMHKHLHTHTKTSKVISVGILRTWVLPTPDVFILPRPSTTLFSQPLSNSASPNLHPLLVQNLRDSSVFLHEVQKHLLSKSCVAVWQLPWLTPESYSAQTLSLSILQASRRMNLPTAAQKCCVTNNPLSSVLLNAQVFPTRESVGI